MFDAVNPGRYLPTGEYEQLLAVRAYEPRADGAVDMGGLFRYCEIAANAASAAAGHSPIWYFARGEGWVIYRQTVEAHAPIGIGGEVLLQTWVSSYTRVSAQRNYLLRRASDGAIIARGEATWAYVSREDQSPRRIPAEVPVNTPIVERTALSPRPEWGRALVFPQPDATLRWMARGYEADTLKHINNCVYADWLSEAARMAFAMWSNANDPILAHLVHGPLLARRLAVNYQRSARPGDIVVLMTCPERVGSRGLVLHQTIALDHDPTSVLLTATATYVQGMPA
jgi:acyl-CoA thioesterase FadM